MRLFLAVNPPTRLREELATRLDTVRRRVRIAWTRPETWHLTLAFLGDWPEHRLPSLGQALRAGAERHGSLLIRPREVGAFPHLRNPRVLFLHLDGGDPLRDLAGDLRRAVDASWPDGPQDRKSFRPHLTLARVKRPLAGAEQTVLRALDLGDFESFEVTSAELMASELRPEGACHTVVESLRLGG